MKRLVLFTLLVSLLFVPTVYAQQKYALGFGNVALKVDYFRFLDSAMDDLDFQNGLFVGIEGYVASFLPNLYFGIETGLAGTSGSSSYGGYKIDLSADYVPIEFNMKYAFEASPELVFDLGAGFSLNYIDIEQEFGGLSTSSDDWLLGGQFFANVDYKFLNGWFVGANVKFQLTDDTHIDLINKEISASNFRIGGQVGFLF